MAISSVKYYITDANGNFIDWNQSVSGLSILGKEAEISGGSGVDGVFVQAAASANLSDLGGGNDKVYLTGNFGQYVQTIDQATGVYTFTRTGGLTIGQTEVVKVTAGTDDDVLYFADGHMTFNAATDSRLYDGSTFFSVQTGWLAVGGTLASGPNERNTPTTAGSPTRVFVTDAGGVDLPGLSQPGQKMTVIGSAGADSVYLKSGTTIDASDLGGGNDKIYLTGNLADYAQTLDQATGVYTLSRTTASGVESVKVTAGTDDDRLYFADGHIVFNASTDSRLYDGATFFNLQASLLVSGGTPGTTATVTTLNVSTAPNLSGQSVISGKALANASVTIAIDPDNNAATSNSFTYAVTADANGDYSLNLATAAPASGTASFVAGTASISVTQAVPGGASPATVITLPVSTSTSYSASIASDHVTEGGNAVFTVTRSGDTSGAGTVVYATQNGTAAAPGDYTSAGGTLSFAAGQTSKTVTVTTVDDANVESNETLSLVLSNPTGGVLGTASATATIVDNEGALFSIDGTATGVSFSEGVGTYTFTVHRSGLTTGAATVVVNSGGGTATAGSDYTAVNQTLSFAAGETSKTVAVSITDDAAVEGNETFNLQLSSPSAGALIDATQASVTATIQDNEVAVISIDNAAAGLAFSEGVGSVTFSLTRSGDTTSAVTVVVQSSGGTATPGTGGSNDYNAVNQTISFAAGETAKTVTVTINEDALPESNETFNLQLANPTGGAIIASGAGGITATIQDNDQSVWSVASNGDVSESAGSLTYTVSRTGATSAATIQFSTAGGTATAGAGNDYTAIAGQTLSFAAGETSKTVTVAVNDDANAEGNETVVVAISNASAGSINTATASATILDNDQSVWSVASAGDVSESAGSLTYTVSRTGATSAATIQFSTAGGTATAGAGNDYTAIAGQTLSFAAGETSKTVTVAINDDAIAEGNETVVAAISNASAGSINTATASATILDNDQAIWSVSSAGNVSEGAGALTYTVSRTGATNAAATIVFATAGGTATGRALVGNAVDIAGGADYGLVGPQTLSFAAGETSKTVSVLVGDDTLAEGNETVVGSISNASAGGSINTATASATILDNDQSVWSVASAGNVDEGAGALTYTVSRTGATNNAETIVFATAGGTATGKALVGNAVDIAGGADYGQVGPQTLSFAAGETSKTVSVLVGDDLLAEGNETVGVTINNASHGMVTTATASATILDNDQSLWSVASTGNVGEGAGSLSYTVTRTGATNATATIVFSTAGGTATGKALLGDGSVDIAGGADYGLVAAQTLTFAAGETSKTISVLVGDDTLAETYETVVVAISDASAGSISTATASATIQDNDQSVWSVISAGDADEGTGFLTFIVARDGATDAATIEFATGGSGAAGYGYYSTAGVDYTALSRTLSFAAGETSKAINVSVIDDTLLENNEAVAVLISNASKGTISTGSAKAFILDNDLTSWAVTSTGDANEGSGSLTFLVTRSNAADAATIDFATANNSATAGSDYTALIQTLSFAPGELSKAVSVALINDALAESNEVVNATIGNASAGILKTATASATILDDDQSIWSVASAGDVSEGAGLLTYVVTRTGAMAAATIQFATQNGTATQGSDYTARSGTLSFADGEVSKVVEVAVINDAVAETNETVSMAVSNASAGSIATSLATATILEDDQSIWSVGTDSHVSEGSGFIYFYVSRTGATNAATITFVTTDGGSASGGPAFDGSDYIGVNKVLTFAAGEVTQTVAVALINDSVAENNETFTTFIFTPSSGVAPAALSRPTIFDDDVAISIAVPGSYLSSQSVISGSAAANGSITVTIDPDNNAGTANSFSYVTTVGADGNYSLNLATATPTSGTASFTGGVASINATQYIDFRSGTATSVIAPFSYALANGPVATEGGNAVFTVNRAGDTSVAGTVTYSTQGGSAGSGSDFTAAIGTLTFAAGETSKTISVATVDDAIGEANENFTLTLLDGGGAVILPQARIATATIQDNDVSVWSVASAGDVAENAGPLSFTVTRTGATGAATIRFGTAGGTATPGADFTAGTQVLSFAAGETSKTVTVAVANDAAGENNETVVGAISNASAGTIATAAATATILDDDQSVWSIASAGDVNENAGLVSYTISRTGGSAAATVEFAAVGGTATPGSDVAGQAPTVVSFAAGQMSKTVTLALTDDALAELNETVIAAIGNTSSGTIATASATVTILDNDQSHWSVAAVTAGGAEVDGYAEFTVTRTGSLAAASINFGTTTAETASDADYATTSQTLSFAAGQASTTVRVRVYDDSIAETAETVMGVISGASAGNIEVSNASYVIAASDQTRSLFAITAAATSTGEDNAQASYIVTRSGDLSSAQTIESYVSGGTATSGADYTAFTPVTLSFAAGESSKVVSVDLIADAATESSETLIMGLRNASGGVITTSSATVTLVDSETVTAASYSIAATSANVYENAGAAAYTITRSGDASAVATTYFRSNGGTATAGTDYTAIAGQTLSWGVGETTKVVFVSLLDDASAESTETLIGQIATNSGFSTGLATATVNLLDNDTAASGAVTYTVTALGSPGESSGAVFYEIKRSGDLTATSTSYARGVNPSTAIPWALGGFDYISTGDVTLQWAAGESTKVLSITLLNDTTAESNEMVRMAISTVVNLGGNVTSSNPYIWDDDTFTAAAGGADVLTTGVTSASVFGNQRINTGDMGDSVTIGSVSSLYNVIDLGSGDDTLFTGTTPTTSNFYSPGSQYAGGTGTDTLALQGTTAFNFPGLATAGNFIKGFEIVSMGATGNQTLNLSLQDVLEFTTGNAVANTLRITGNAGDILNLQVAGKTLTTLAAGTGNLTDVDGTTYNVVADGSGNNATNDVVIGGRTYDVYQYQHSGQTVTLLVDTLIQTPGLGPTSTVYSTAENSTAVATLAGIEVASWSTTLTGADAALFTLSAGGVLTFNAAKNYEAAADDAGGDRRYDIVAQYTDSGHNVVSQFVAVNLTNVNEAPTITAQTPDSSIAAGSALNINAATAFTDPDTTAAFNTLSYSLAALPSGLSGISINSSTGVISGTVGGIAGNYTVTVNANDGSNTTSEQFVLHSTATEGVSTYAVAANGYAFEGPGTSLGFRVTRSGNVNVASTSYFETTTGGTATAGTDYTAIPAQALNWSVGETIKFISVNTINDTIAEATGETVAARSATDSGFTANVTTASEFIYDDDFYIATPGVADTLTMGTASGGYAGGRYVNTGDMNDAVTLPVALDFAYVIDLGTGNDSLIAKNNFLSASAGQFTGGSGVDTLALTTATTFNFNTTVSAAYFLKGFELVDMTATGNQTLNLNLDYALQFATGNAVADTLRITGNAGDVLNLSKQGQTLVTVAPGTSLIDVDGAAYTVAASAAGNASASDVTIGGRVYDVYQYQYTGHTVNLLVDTLITTTVI